MPEAVTRIDRESVMELQRNLQALGFFKGKSDGYYGPETASAIRAFEKTTGRIPVGALTLELIKAVQAASVVAPPPARSDALMKIVQGVAAIANKDISTPRPATDTDMIRKAQSGLYSLGFLQGKIDGVAGESTAKAIRQFEVYYNYEVTGAVTPELIDLLAIAGAES